MLDSFLTIATHPLLWMFIGLTVVFFGVQGLVGRSAEAPTAPDERISRLAEKVGMKGLHPVLFLILLLTWGIVAGTLFAGLYAILWQVIFHAPPEGAENVWNWRFTLAQLVALTTVLGAVIALPITINRLILTRRQTDTVEQGHITDRINKAVEGLGAEKTVKRDDREWTDANLEVRIGAIYALERIAQDSARDHVQIMEILCAYIRQNAPASDAQDWPELAMKEVDENGSLEEDWEERLKAFNAAQNEVRETLACRTDIQTALTVIGRRSAEQRQIEAGPGNGEKGVFPFDILSPELELPPDDYDRAELKAYISDMGDWKLILEVYRGYRLDLRRTNLQAADLSRLNLSGAVLEGAQMHGTALRFANLRGADLWNTSLHGAYLNYAELHGADLAYAELLGADLAHAHLDGVDLGWAGLSDFTVLEQASLLGGALRCQDLSDLMHLKTHVQQMFGDASVILPGGHGPEHESWPAHWPTRELDYTTFQNEWRKWQADPENYMPPEAPEEG